MIKTLLMAAVAVGALAVTPAHAEDVKTMVEPAPAMAPADAAVSAAAEAAEDGVAAAAVTETTLKDGTKVKIEGEAVTVEKDGTFVAAPDGEHELADGTKVTTHGGKVVKAGAAH